MKGFGERRRELGGMEGRAAGCWRTLSGRRGWNNQEGVPGLLGGCWRRGEYGVTRGTQGGERRAGGHGGKRQPGPAGGIARGWGL